MFTEHILKKMLDNGQELNKLAQWSSFLIKYCIMYESQKVEKGHAITSLLTEFLVEDVLYEDLEVANEHMIVASLSEVQQRLIYADGSHRRLGSKLAA